MNRFACIQPCNGGIEPSMDDGCEFYSNDSERLCVFWLANAVNLSGWQITFDSALQKVHAVPYANGHRD